jgi:hypothetical protein
VVISRGSITASSTLRKPEAPSADENVRLEPLSGGSRGPISLRAHTIYKEWTMNIDPVTQPPAAALAARASKEAASAIAARVSPSEVSASVLQRANGDGDGRTGTAALNDGDQAARAAAQQVKSMQQAVDVKA